MKLKTTFFYFLITLSTVSHAAIYSDEGIITSISACTLEENTYNGKQVYLWDNISSSISIEGYISDTPYSNDSYAVRVNGSYESANGARISCYGYNNKCLRYHVTCTISSSMLNEGYNEILLGEYTSFYSNTRYYGLETTPIYIKKESSFTITFDPNGGALLDSLTKTVAVGSTYGKLPTPSWGGYAFDGWYTAAAGGTKIMTTTVVSISADQTLYAHWTPATTYTITFDANGGTIPAEGNLGITPAAQTSTLNTEQTIGTVVVTSGLTHFRAMEDDCPTREGYIFDGWWTDATAGTQVYDATGLCVTGVYWGENYKWIGTSDLTVYAHWKKNTIGLFSVSDNRKVRFSFGNLQYNATRSTHLCADGTIKQGTWRFAEHQWEIIGEDNTNASADYSGWIDLFAWGTSGWNSGVEYYQPWATGANAVVEQNKYLQKSLRGDYQYADWAIYNEISNSIHHKWRCPTRAEWIYILEQRPNNEALMGYATVVGQTGLILLPDEWELPEGLTFNPVLLDYSANVYSENQWNIMEDNGAVFLPAAGHSYPTEIIALNSGGWYCSSDVVASSNADTQMPVSSSLLRFASDALSMHYDNHRFASGRSVRPIEEMYHVVVLPNTTEGGNTSGNGYYAFNTSLSISATPNEHYHFVRWSDGNTDNPRIVVVDRDTTYTAEFESDVLALDDTQDNTAALTVKLGQNVDVTLVGRTLLGGMWNTLCLPFDVPTLAGTPLENCQIVSYVDATGNGIDGIDMQFEYVTALSAGTPYLVKPVADIVEPTFEGVTISAIDGLVLSGSGNVDFVGVLKPVNLLAEATAPYIMGLNNMIYVPAAGMFKAYRAYFDIVNPALHNAPLRVVVHDQTTTGVQATTVAPKVFKQIVNGQMIIIRDGKTYNAQGIEL